MGIHETEYIDSKEIESIFNQLESKLKLKSSRIHAPINGINKKINRIKVINISYKCNNCYASKIRQMLLKKPINLENLSCK